MARDADDECGEGGGESEPEYDAQAAHAATKLFGGADEIGILAGEGGEQFGAFLLTDVAFGKAEL